MTIDIWYLVGLTLLGVLAGVLNVAAGGGSLMTVPAMIFMGMDGATANGTNRLAIFTQNAAAVASFRQRGLSDLPLGLLFAAAALPGAALGAWTGTRVSGELFNYILAGVMVFVLLSMQLKAKAPVSGPVTYSRARLTVGLLLMVGVGFYGGFIQAGVGFLVMLVLHRFLGYDLVRTNMYKVLIVLIYTAVALPIFALRGQFVMGPAIALAIGMTLGGYLGAHLSVSRGEAFIRPVLNLVLIAMILKLLLGG